MRLRPALNEFFDIGPSGKHEQQETQIERVFVMFSVALFCKSLRAQVTGLSGSGPAYVYWRTVFYWRTCCTFEDCNCVVEHINMGGLV